MANAKKKKPEFKPEELPFLEDCCCCEPEINAIFKVNVPEAAWGKILGNIQNQEDLIALLKEKQDVLTEANAGDGISITVDEEGIVKISNTRVSAVWGKIEGDISNQEDLMELLESIKNDLTDKIDTVEDTLNDKIDTVEGTLNDKIDTVEGTLNDKIDTVEGTLNDKIDAANDHIDEVEETLTEEINKKQDILTEDNAGDGISITNEDGTVKINNTRVSAVWGNIEGNITDQTDLVEYIDENGGKIDVIKRNDVVLPIEDKTVNIEVPEEANEIDYTNGAVPSITNVQEALDNLMNIHYYVNPSYTTFTVDRSGNYDVGTVLEQPFAVNWSLNKTPVAGDTQTLKFDGTTILNIMNEPQSSWKSGSYNYTAGNITSNSPKTYTFRVDYTDNHSTVPSGKTNTCNASRTFGFYYRRYWGVTSTETLSDEQLYALSNELSSARGQDRDFNCSGGKYWWIVIPTIYCNGIQFTDVASGLPMTLPASCISTRTITNSKGVSFSVNVYRGEYKQTASSVRIKVS